MRVFDFVGVTEAVGEIRDELEGQRAVNHEKEEWKESVVVEQGWPATPLPPRRTVVADSEDEDEDDEMLFDAEATITTPAPPVQEPEPAPTQRPHPKSEKQYQEIQTSGKVKFILIDTLAQVLNPLLKKDYIQGQPPSPSHPSFPRANTRPSKYPSLHLANNRLPPNPYPHSAHHPLQPRNNAPGLLASPPCAESTSSATSETTPGTASAALGLHE
ncbi:hypothetical protein EJ02DRAFT_471640 [Clathrospora elynae]|uniref:Uncharacterized protein n=1 Tax=Clathrospora elynae TaxID=706981 RepID=A0A6A5SBG8_9PLEO|nr:hypothetical protein EJ02DRAFT_471640 [Clathrospora elynae]